MKVKKAPSEWRGSLQVVASSDPGFQVGDVVLAWANILRAHMHGEGQLIPRMIFSMHMCIDG